MPTYVDVGFNTDLLRPIEASYTEQIGIESASAYDQISGNQVKGDSIKSLNGNMEIDLQGDRYVVRDGTTDRIELGKLSDGTVGLIIRDTQGNELMRISGDINIIKSANGAVEIDFNEERILIRDQGGTPRILLGKQIGGF